MQRLNDASDTLNLQQMVNFITHPNSSSETNGSVIDLLFTNRPDMFTNICVQPRFGSSDHYGVSCNILTSCDVKSVTRLFYQYNKADLTTLCETLCRVPWGTCFSPESDINEVWDQFKDLLFATVSDIVPVAKQKGKKRYPWISAEIITLSVFRAAKLNPANINLWTKYKTLRNKIKYSISLHNHIFLMFKIWLRIPHQTQNSFGHLLVVNARKILSPVFGQPLALY